MEFYRLEISDRLDKENIGDFLEMIVQWERGLSVKNVLIEEECIILNHG